MPSQASTTVLEPTPISKPRYLKKHDDARKKWYKYGVAMTQVVQNGRSKSQVKLGAVIHRSTESDWYGRSILACGTSSAKYSWSRATYNQLTTGTWSFKTKEPWDPMEDHDDADAVFMALTGMGVPQWAYELPLCERCFPGTMQKHVCSCGDNHKARKNAIR